MATIISLPHEQKVVAYKRFANRAHPVATPNDLWQQAIVCCALMPVYVLATMWIGLCMAQIGANAIEQTLQKHFSLGSFPHPGGGAGRARAPDKSELLTH